MEYTIAILLAAGLLFLVAGGELLVRGASAAALKLGISPTIIGLTVVAFGTSAPELAVSLDAAFKGNADISVSNVVGSNIFNVLFILGVSSLIAPLAVKSQMIRREVPLLIGVSLLLLLFSLNGPINQMEGLLLVLIAVVYTGWLVFEVKKHRIQNKEIAKESAQEYAQGTRPGSLGIAVAFFIAGLALIMFGANWLVEGATKTAQAFGVSDSVIGLTIVAAGTSLPEVVASVMATLKGERDIAVANVMGSNIYNILGIVGLSASIVPGGLNVASPMLSFDIPVMLAAALICLPFFWSGKKLSRIEGAALLVFYVVYTTIVIFKAAA